MARKRRSAEKPLTIGTPTGSAPLELSHIHKTYQQGDEQVEALKDVSFSLRAGTLVVILGPSGCGKSTLLHIMGGMDRASGGQVLVSGRDISSWSSDELSKYRRSDVGFVFQSYNLLPTQTAAENVMMPLWVAGCPKAERLEKALDLLQRVGLEGQAAKRVNHMSGGQAQRVAIARALAGDPRLVLADEPTGNLDSLTGTEVMGLLQSMAHEDGRCVVVVTHNEEFTLFADRVIRIRDGEIRSDEATAGDGGGLDEGDRSQDSMPGEVAARGNVKLGALLRMAWRNQASRKARGVLTAAGIAIGVALTVLLVGIGVGIKSTVVASVSSFGPLTMIDVSPPAPSSALGGPGSSPPPGTTIGAHKLAVLAHMTQTRAAYVDPTFVDRATVGRASAAVAIATLPPARIRSVPGILPQLTAGTLPAGSGQVALPRKVAATLAGSSRSAAGLVGKTVTLVSEGEMGPVLGGAGSVNSPVGKPPVLTLVVKGIVKGPTGFVTLPTATSWMASFQPPGQPPRYPGLAVVAKSVSGVSPIVAKARHMDLTVVSLEQTVKSISNGFKVIETALGAIGAIALVVAGLMIGVVMSMSVLERRREIGVLRAIGARRRDVSRLFLLQALLIGAAGGLAGVGLAWGGGTIVDAVVGHLTHRHTPVFGLPPWLALGGVALGGVAAVLAGTIPARRAASLNPVDALRQE